MDCSDMSELSHWPTCRPVGLRIHCQPPLQSRSHVDFPSLAITLHASQDDPTMNRCQDELRRKVARKTKAIVDKQTPLALEEFLAQGRKRSRQQRKISPVEHPMPFGGLGQAASLA